MHFLFFLFLFFLFLAHIISIGRPHCTVHVSRTTKRRWWRCWPLAQIQICPLHQAKPRCNMPLDLLAYHWYENTTEIYACTFFGTHINAHNKEAVVAAGANPSLPMTKTSKQTNSHAQHTQYSRTFITDTSFICVITCVILLSVLNSNTCMCVCTGGSAASLRS